MIVWPVRKQTAAAGISAFIPAAGQFTSRKRIRLSVAQLLLRLDQQTSTGSRRCRRSFSPIRRHVTFSVYCRKELHKQFIFFVNLNTDIFFYYNDLTSINGPINFLIQEKLKNLKKVKAGAIGKRKRDDTYSLIRLEIQDLARQHLISVNVQGWEGAMREAHTNSSEINKT